MKHNRTARKDRRLLEVGDVNKWWCRLSHLKMLDVAHNADDLPWAVFVPRPGIVAHKNSLADWIFIGKIAACESLIDNHAPRCSFGVVIIQVAALSQRNFQCTENARTHFEVPCVRPLLRRRRGFSQDRETLYCRAMRGQLVHPPC